MRFVASKVKHSFHDLSFQRQPTTFHPTKILRQLTDFSLTISFPQKSNNLLNFVYNLFPQKRNNLLIFALPCYFNKNLTTYWFSSNQVNAKYFHKTKQFIEFRLVIKLFAQITKIRLTKLIQQKRLAMLLITSSSNKNEKNRQFFF
jgi:hypothetical protein